MNPFRTGLKGFLFTCAATAALTGWAMSAPGHAQASASVKVQINDDLVHFPDAQPFIDEKSTTQVPVRFVSENLGYKVDWSEAEGQIRVMISHHDGDTIEMTTGNPTVKVNGTAEVLESAPRLQDGRVYVPLRFLSETAGIRVQWDDRNDIAILNEDGEYHAPAWYAPAKQMVATFTATAYSNAPNENGGFGGLDYFGNPLVLGTVAVDPNVIPLGTRLYIEGYDANGLPAGGMTAIAADTGSAIKGNKLDIYMPGPKTNAIQFGIQQVKVYKLP